MRFILHVSALDGDDGTLRHIDRIIDRVEDLVHVVEVPEADLLHESAWFKNARNGRKKLLTSAVANPPRQPSSRRGPHLRVEVVSDFASAQRADKLAHTPLTLLVEDSASDGVFLEILFEEMAWPTLDEVWQQGQLTSPPAVELKAAGGSGSILARIAEMVQSAASQGRPTRLFVLRDSDARWPGDDKSEGAKQVAELREACEAQAVPLHVWRKRCTESYIPDQVFKALLDDPNRSRRHEQYRALLRRSREQRDHFPLKDKMSQAEREAAIGAGLYGNSDLGDLEILQKERLFPKRPRPLSTLAAEQRPAFTASGLNQRDGQGEIEELLLMIAAEL